MQIARLSVPRRRNDCGEYHCRAYLADGRRYPDGDYFTTDLDDALCTALDVLDRYSNCEGYTDGRTP